MKQCALLVVEPSSEVPLNGGIKYTSRMRALNLDSEGALRGNLEKFVSERHNNVKELGLED